MELNALCRQIHDQGVLNWVNKFAEDQAFGYLEVSDAPDSCDWTGFYLRTVGKERFGHADYSHGTTSAILPGLLSMGALLSSDELKSAELTKVAGEYERWETSQDSDMVSFWDHGRGYDVRACYGEISGFDFPIALTVTKKAMAGNIVQEGTVYGEVTVPNRFPLEDIEYLLVPPFAQRYVGELLALHGYGCVKVAPLTTSPDSVTV